jgi:hypothetical protein
MDNELICLPEPSITKTRAETNKVTPPRPVQPTAPATEVSKVTTNEISPLDVPLPPPGEDELVDACKDPVTNSELPTPITEVTPTPNANKDDVDTVNPHGRRSTRIRKPSIYVRKILAGEVDGGTARGKSRLPKGLQVPTGSAAIAGEYESDLDSHASAIPEIRYIEHAMAVQIEDGTSDDDPKTLAQAMARPDWSEWEKAMEEELALMAKYEVWDVVDEPDDTNIVGSRWVFRIKRDSNGKILKYRARLVAQGFTQMYGVDFQDTFAPVARLSSIRAVIALAASEDWELHQMDVKSAYLNSPIDTAVYMRLPPGHSQKGKVARVKRGIYGLRQSGNLWHKTLTSAFSELELTRSAVDHGVFYSHDDEGTTIVCSSTDDFAIAASSVKEDFRELTLYYFTYIVVADVYVFGPFFGHWVTGDEYRALVIPTYRDGFELVAELPHKGMHPDHLAAAI